jgi:DNA modification methylase
MRPGGQVLVNLGMIHRDGEWMPYWEGWIEWMRSQGWRRFGWYVWDQGPELPGDWNGRLAPSHEWIFHFNRVAEQARKTVKTKYGGLTTHLRPSGSSTGLREKDGKVGAWTHASRRTQDMRIPDSVVRALRLLGGEWLDALFGLTDEDVAQWPDSVVRIMRHKARGIERRHPAVFPVALPAEMLRAYSDDGDVLYEPFCGAGSTVIAAEMNDRTCYGMEIGPPYVDVTVQRWQNFTQQEAVLAAGGESFEAVAARRQRSKAA